MCLNYERISLARLIVIWLIQHTARFPTFLVLPSVNVSLSHFDVLELWIGVPDDSRYFFVGGNQHGRFVKALLYVDFKSVLPERGRALDLCGEVPRTVSPTFVLVDSK